VEYIAPYCARFGKLETGGSIKFLQPQRSDRSKTFGPDGQSCCEPNQFVNQILCQQ
jgi:hypothetical protein